MGMAKPRTQHEHTRREPLHHGSREFKPSGGKGARHDVSDELVGRRSAEGVGPVFEVLFCRAHFGTW